MPCDDGLRLLRQPGRQSTRHRPARPEGTDPDHDGEPGWKRKARVGGFDLEATSEALLGLVSGLECELTVHVGGQEIQQRSGRGSLRVDPKL